MYNLFQIIDLRLHIVNLYLDQLPLLGLVILGLHLGVQGVLERLQLPLLVLPHRLHLLVLLRQPPLYLLLELGKFQLGTQHTSLLVLQLGLSFLILYYITVNSL